MRIEVAAAATACAIVLLLSTPTTTAQPTLYWGARALQNQTAQGEGIPILVWGTPNGTYHVTVSEEPFNNSPAVVTYTEQLPTHATSPTGYSYANFSVPTTDLYIGPAQIRVWNDSAGTFSDSTVRVTEAANLTALELRMQNLEQQENYTEARLESLAGIYQSGEQTFVNQEAWLLGVFGVGWTAVLFLWVFVPSPLASTRRGIAVQRAFRSLGKRRAYVGPLEGTGEPDRSPALSPGQSFVGRMFPTCTECRVPTTLAVKTAHYRTFHGIPNPKLGVHIEQRIAEMRRRLSSAPVQAPDVRAVRDSLRNSGPIDGFRG